MSIFREKAKLVSDRLNGIYVSEGIDIIEAALIEAHNDGVDSMAHAAAEFCWDPENRLKCLSLSNSLKLVGGGK